MYKLFVFKTRFDVKGCHLTAAREPGPGLIGPKVQFDLKQTTPKLILASSYLKLITSLQKVK